MKRLKNFLKTVRQEERIWQSQCRDGNVPTDVRKYRDKISERQ